MASNPLIKVEQLQVVYNPGKEYAYTALRDINLEIYPEEYIIFFGPSGCGKSTMLYTILGLIAPHEGRVMLEGRDYKSLSEQEKTNVATQFYGIIFQNFNLVYSLNVFDNVVLPQVFTGVAPRKRAQTADELLIRFGIDAKAKILPTMLSGGQQQRVAIARALINNPQVLLADEPVGNLDSESAEVVMTSLSDINRQDKKTIILVTHDASYLHFADRVFFFKDGRLDRVVTNSKKVTPGSPRQTALEELSNASRTYGFLNLAELKAWGLTNYLIEECTAAQAARLEKAMENLLSGSLSEHGFFEELHRPFVDGGVGLYVQTALRYAQRIVHVLATLKTLRLGEFDTLQEPERSKVLQAFTNFLLEDYHGFLNEAQMQQLKVGMAKRLTNKTTAEALVEFLNRPLTAGGAGFHESTSRHLSNRLETAIRQGQKE